DGFAYADSYEDGRFTGLTMTAPTAVRQGGLVVDPVVAAKQIEADTRTTEGASGGSSTGSGAAGTPGGGAGAGGQGSETSTTGGRAATTAPARFHATKDLTVNRVVRDA